MADVLIILVVLAIAVSWVWLEAACGRFVRRAPQICDRILKQQDLPNAGRHRVFFADVTFLRRPFRWRRFQGVGVLFLDAQALVLHGEIRDGATYEMTLPRDEVSVLWAARAPVPLARHWWMRVSTPQRCLFFTPAEAGTSIAGRDTQARELYTSVRTWSVASEGDATAARQLDRPGRLANTLAALVIVAILAGLFGLVDSARTLGTVVGPSDLALGPDGRIVVVQNPHLHVLDRQGMRIESRSLASLGVEGFVSDLHFDRGGRLYLGGEGGRIRRCDPDGWDCDTLRLSPHNAAPRRTYKFALDEAGERILVTDTARHRLSVFTLGGVHRYTTRGETPPLCFPNAVVVDGDGSLLIADTNNHRVAAFDTMAGDELHTRWSLYTAEIQGSRRTCKAVSRLLPGRGNPWLARELDFHMKGRPRALGVAGGARIWPSEVTRDRQGRLWVINAGGDMSYGALLRYADHHAAPEGIHLGADADPTALLVLDDTIVVADFFGFRLLEIDQGDRAVDFARGTYAEELTRDRARYRRARRVRTLCAIGLPLALVLVLTVLVVHTVSARGRALRWPS